MVVLTSGISDKSVCTITTVECLVYGVGSTYVYEAHETLQRLGWTVRAYVANLEGGFRPDALEPVIDAVDLPAEWLGLGVVFPMVTPGHRQAVEREARRRGFESFPIVVDPTTVVASSVRAGEGTQVNAAAVIGANTTLGRFTLVNRSVSVGHDVVLDDYASLGPAAVLCGGVNVGRGAFVGAGAVLNPDVSIGENSVVGAGAGVTAAGPGAAGVPAATAGAAEPMRPRHLRRSSSSTPSSATRTVRGQGTSARASSRLPLCRASSLSSSASTDARSAALRYPRSIRYFA